jgi:hypothetical protein
MEQLPKCNVRGCPATAAVKGMCVLHYQADRRSKITTQCSVKGCGLKAYVGELCAKHYTAERTKRLAASGEKCKQCDNPVCNLTLQLCSACYQKAWRRGHNLCSVSRCSGKITANGLCARHNAKQQKAQIKGKKS